jgi:hypothetical protein
VDAVVRDAVCPSLRDVGEKLSQRSAPDAQGACGALRMIG